MEKNVGSVDRVARIVIGVAIAILIVAEVVTGIAAIVAAILAAYLILCGLAARCLFYKAAGIDTTIDAQPYSTTDDRSGL